MLNDGAGPVNPKWLRRKNKARLADIRLGGGDPGVGNFLSMAFQGDTKDSKNALW